LVYPHSRKPWIVAFEYIFSRSKATEKLSRLFLLVDMGTIKRKRKFLVPNAETIQAFEDAHLGKDIFTCDTVEELFEELNKDDSSTE